MPKTTPRQVVKTKADGSEVIYPSISAAARANYMYPRAMRLRCTGAKKSPELDGSTYKFLEEDKIDETQVKDKAR